ncbi:MAG: hypothetical protein OHK0046_22160 [Anaerolineae bacterium]
MWKQSLYGLLIFCVVVFGHLAQDAPTPEGPACDSFNTGIETTPEPDAAEDAPDREGVELALFVSSLEDVAFCYPAAWSVEEDAETVFFLIGPDDLSTLIQITPVDLLDAEAVAARDPLSPADLLELEFESDAYSPPQPLMLGEEREAAVIQSEVETIAAFFLDSETFALVYVIAPARIRDEYEDAALITARTLTYGEAAVAALRGITIEAPEVTVDEEALSTLTEGVFPFAEGELTVRYPAEWEAFAMADYGISLANPALTTAIVIGDVGFIFDALGGEGLAANVTSPQAALETVIGQSAGDVGDLFQTYSVNGRAVARIDLLDDISLSSLIGVQLPGGTVLVMTVQADAEDVPALLSVLDPIIASLSYSTSAGNTGG